MTLIRQGGAVVDVPPPPRIWKTGEPVRIATGGRTVDGRIELASPNGISVFITYDGFLHPAGAPGGYLGGMAAMWNGRDYQDLAGLGIIELKDPETSHEGKGK